MGRYQWLIDGIMDILNNFKIDVSYTPMVHMHRMSGITGHSSVLLLFNLIQYTHCTEVQRANVLRRIEYTLRMELCGRLKGAKVCDLVATSDQVDLRIDLLF